MGAKASKIADVTAAKNSSTSGKAADVEVITEVPDLMTPEVVRQLALVEKVIGRADQMTDAKLAGSIKDWVSQAADFSRQAVEAGASALVYAWACGKLMNAAKKNLSHGNFGKWRKKHLESAGISVRTSTRYMQLAAQCHDVRGLLQWAPTLKQAYVACGILPGSSMREGGEQDGGESEAETSSGEEDLRKKEIARKKEVLLKTVGELQQRLSQGVGIRENLDKDEIRQLTLAKKQIYDFFEKILGKQS